MHIILPYSLDRSLNCRMPNPQNPKATSAPSKESETQPDGKGKEQINPWSRRGAGVISQLQQNHGVMVTPSAGFSPPSQLQALLEDKKQTVVFHPNPSLMQVGVLNTELLSKLSRDTASQSPIIHLSPTSSTSILNLQPARLYPVMAKHKNQHPITQGFNLTSLGWAQQEARLGKPEEVILGKNSSTFSSLSHSQPLNTVKTQKKLGVQNKESPEPICPVYYRGACTFPGCGKAFEDHRHFLRHLHSDHHLDDKSTVQCLIQTEVVHKLEEQLAVEKERLHHMQSQMSGKLNTQALHLSQRECGLILHPTHPSISAWSGLDLSSPLQKEFSDTILALRRQLWEGSSLNIFQNMANCIEYYKTNNVRPPFTYASLIRWAILESPQKQLALNEIYHWFTRMFAFFRYNTATWKNAVRHNLSLHKCFVRVENIKGAVWMVDELEFQRKRGVRNSR
ncbi:forkhead box P3 L homeolog isoform X1 [Xenopus laevis]|uniref:Forkhead box P3 L homeolog isoform X1 n=1 Tax=Xenopus laevis TaxID=8355 RepID=A0A8J1LE30_XENLA|nr:forkhead box P3 L homeolog isoform X1 [Xenopus laevis]